MPSICDLSTHMEKQVHRHRSNSNTTTSNSAGGEDAAFYNLLNRFEQLLIEFIQMPQVQESFIRWHQNMRNIVRKIDELLSQCPKAILVSLLLVIIFVLIQFYATEISIVLCLWHYVDMTIFNSSGSSGSGCWMLISRIVFRQFMILQLLGQSVFIFAASIFQPISVNPLLIPNPSFRSTLYIVFITEYFIMDCVLCAKILVFNLPKCSKICKRRLYQWLEYSAAIYRFAIPFGQWNAYLNAMWWNVLYNRMWMVYGGMKILLILSLTWHWLLTTLRLFRPIHLGTAPSEAECRMIEQCTICFGEFTSPTKLKCGHIFCSQCIRTWVVEHGHITCPYCRTVMTKEDNNYRNGDSMFPVLV